MKKGNEYRMTHEDGHRYLFGGRCWVAFVNTNTGNKFTFQISKAVKHPGIYYVSWVNKPEKKIKKYIGTIFNYSQFRVTAKSQLTLTDQPVSVFTYVFSGLVSGRLPKNIEIYNLGFCSNCGRPLSDKNSILKGLGPSCLKKITKYV